MAVVNVHVLDRPGFLAAAHGNRGIFYICQKLEKIDDLDR